MDNQALYKLTYGLFLLTANENGSDNGCIINTVMQVANNPTRIAIAVLKNNKTHDMIKSTGAFNISSITTKADFELFKRFGMQSGRDVDKFEGFKSVSRSKNGLYYLTDMVNMYISAKVTEKLNLDTHTLFVAEVTEAEVLSDEVSCTYGYYQGNIKPKPEEKNSWVCSVCGYVYEGDELPDDFECPLCHHGKEDFVRK